MAKFKKGDKFIPRKPKDISQYPLWDRAMDKFSGQILTIRKINSEGMLEGAESDRYCFHPDWCEKVEVVEPMKAGIEMISDEHIGTNYYRVEGMGDNCDAKLSTNAKSTDASANFALFNHIEASKLSPQTQPLSTEIDWEQRRYELIKAYIAVIDATTPYIKIPSILISLADETIKQLKQQ